MHIELVRAEAPYLPPKWIVMADDEALFGPDTLDRCRNFILASRSGFAGDCASPRDMGDD